MKKIAICEKFLAAGTLSNTITIWDLEKLKEQHLFPDKHQDLITSLTISSNENYLASGTKEGEINIFDLEKSILYFSITKGTRKNGVINLKFSENAKKRPPLFVIYENGLVKRFSLEISLLGQEENFIQSSLSNPESSSFGFINIEGNINEISAIGDLSGKISIINLNKFQEIAFIKSNQINHKISCICFNPLKNGEFIFGAGNAVFFGDNRKIQDSNKALHGHKSTVKCLAFANINSGIY